MLCLIVKKGEPAGAVFDLKPGECTLGRSRSATFHLAAPDISGQHIRIRVSGGSAQLENLSQFGTRIDGAPVARAVTLRPGQMIELGKTTALLVEERPDGEAPTGGGLPAEATIPSSAGAARAAADADADATRAAAAGDDLSELTRAQSMPAYGDEEGATEGATRAMQTRAATPEELEHLKAAERKRLRRRTGGFVALLVGIVVLWLIFRPRTPPPENEIEWSMNEKGEFIDAFEPGPSGGIKDGGYDICYPGNKTFKKKAIEGGVLLEGWIARNLDVPMRILVQETREIRFASMSRAAFVDDWIQQTGASGGSWNFDKPSPTVAFFGRKNGVPFTRVSYLRDGDGSWFGVASVCRHGIRRIVVRAEVPAAERVRAERMLSDKLLRLSDEFEFSYWESKGERVKLVEAEVLAQVRADIDRLAPATWARLCSQLQDLLAQAVTDGHSETEAEALRLLVKLRERQSLWFNSQKLAFTAAQMQSNMHKAEKVAEFTKAVFSDVDDQRYFDVRRWRLEP